MRIEKNFNLLDYNSYKIDSVCKEAWFPDSVEDVISFFNNNKEFVLLGSGHNIILSKQTYDQSFLIFNGNFNNVWLDRHTGVIEAEAGISMLELSEIALANGLSGLEIFYDIPSSLGGAVVMNAGASGEEIKDVLLKVRYLDLDDLIVKEISKDEMNFEYRNSFFQRNKNKIVLQAWLKLKFDDQVKILTKMENIKALRWAKQPKEYPNAGSVFKRPKGYYVGALIDELNLKGFTVGGAKISEKHSGFIVNMGSATGNDIIDLISHIKRSVKEKYNLDLEVEQRII